MRRAVGAMSVAAGLLHGGLAPAHFAEWWGYGVFFAFAAAAQVAYGLALMTGAFDGPRNERFWRPAYAAGVAGFALLIALYVWSRVVGIPLFGPSAGETEDVAPYDLVVKGLELAVLVGSAMLLRRGARSRDASAPAP